MVYTFLLFFFNTSDYSLLMFLPSTCLAKLKKSNSEAEHSEDGIYDQLMEFVITALLKSRWLM